MIYKPSIGQTNLFVIRDHRQICVCKMTSPYVQRLCMTYANLVNTQTHRQTAFDWLY